jgi:HEAT repeat protein
MTTTTKMRPETSEASSLTPEELAALIEVIDDRKVLDRLVELVWEPDGLPRMRALILEHVRGAIITLENETTDLEKAARETRAEALTKRREARASTTRMANRWQANADYNRVRIERLQAIVDRFAG